MLLLIGVAAVSTSAPLIREADAPALAIAFWRTAMASAVLVPLVAVRTRSTPPVPARERRLAIVAGVALAAHFATWIPSLELTTVASSVALVCTQPVWTALLARVRGVPVPAMTWFGIAVALAGVVVLTGVDVTVSARAVAGDALALAGGMLAAVYVVLGAEVRQTVGTTRYTAFCYAAAAVCLLVMCTVGRQELAGYDGRTWLLLVAVTAGPQLLGHSVLNHVVQVLGSTLVSVAILFEVVGATLLAWWWFGESPSAGAYPAAALIAVGVVLVVRSTSRPAVPVD